MTRTLLGGLAAAVVLASGAQADTRTVVVPGLAGTIAIAGEPDRGAVWALQGSPTQLTRWDGRRLRRFPLPTLPGSPNALAAGRDTVYVATSNVIARLTPSTGAVQVWPPGPRPWASGRQGWIEGPQAVTIAGDGTAWLVTGEGEIGHIRGGSLTLQPTRASGTRGPIVPGPDGRIWIGGVLEVIGTVDGTGQLGLIDLPDRAYAASMVRAGRRMVVASGDRSLLELRGSKVVRQRAGIGVTALARRGDHVYGTRPDGSLVRLDARLRPTRVARRPAAPTSLDAGFRHGPLGLVPGPHGGLFTFDDGALVRFTRRAERRGAVPHCRIPAGATTVAASGGRLITTRVLDGGANGAQDRQTWWGCARPSQRPVVLHRADQDWDATAAETLEPWRFAGELAAARAFASTSHYGDGTLRLRVFDLAGKGRGRTIDVGSTSGGVLLTNLVAFALGARGEVLYTTSDVGRANEVRLLGSLPRGAVELARAASITGLRVEDGVAHWIQDGVPRSAPLG